VLRKVLKSLSKLYVVLPHVHNTTLYTQNLAKGNTLLLVLQLKKAMTGITMQKVENHGLDQGFPNACGTDPQYFMSHQFFRLTSAEG